MKHFDYSSVSDPRFFRDNELTPHCDAEYFAAHEESEINARLTGDILRRESVNGSTYFCENFNGSWKILVAGNYDSLVKGWEAPEFNCHDWEDIRVPAHIEMEGHGIPHYTNVAYPWDAHEEIHQGEIPVRNNPVAAYVKYFYVPERFLGERLFISFKGVESSMALFLNGQYIGYAEDTFTTSDFELTDYLTDGENKLGVLVTKWSSGSWLEDQDFFRFSGIFRDVFLYTKPEVHAEDIRIRTILNDDFTSASLEVAIDSSALGTVTLELIDFQNCDALPLPFGINEPRNAASVSGSFKTVFSHDRSIRDGHNIYNFIIPDPKLWSAEKPNLYGLLITMSDIGGICNEIIPLQVGFRRFEMKDGIMCINGRRIVFNGVNRHEFSSVTGRAISFAETRHDLINMKRNNINAIRTCHYPDNSFVYTLADNLGLYIIDETNMETHGTWSYGPMSPERYAEVVPGDNPNWEGAVLDRVNNIYNRDKNHPAILIWSCGNESHGGINIKKMSDRFHELDYTRLVHYEGIVWDRRFNETSDMESQMYTGTADIERFLSEHPEKPFICCEYTHAMGNSCGGMSYYTDLTERNPRFQGGFIWDYIDQSITKNDRHGVAFEAYGGDFGDRPTDGNFSGDGIVYGGAGRESSPKIAEVKYNYQPVRFLFNPDLTYTVVNKALFSDLSDYSCSIILSCNGQEILSSEVDVNVPPLSEKTFTLPTPFKETMGIDIDDVKPDKSTYCAFSSSGFSGAGPKSSAEYSILVKFRFNRNSLAIPFGHEVAYGQKILKSTIVGDEISSENSLSSYRISHGFNTGIKGSDFEIIFNGGGLISYKKCGRELIEGVPVPTFWRASTDNDRGNALAFRSAQWKLADMYSRVTGCNFTEENGRFKADYTYTLPMSSPVLCHLSYLVDFDGRIDITMSFDSSKDIRTSSDCASGSEVPILPELPLFGMRFRFNADFDNLRWYGYGPGESYVDRPHGNPLGTYVSKVSNQLSRYLVPQECANKIGVRHASVTDAKGRGIEFTALHDAPDSGRYISPEMSAELADTFELQALPWTAAELESATHSNELPPIIYTNVRIALAQQGIAGDNSWGARPHQEHLINQSKPLVLHFSMKGI